MRTLHVVLEGDASSLKRSGCLVFALLLSLMLASPGLSSGAFELRVNDVSGLDEPWPLLGGLPFPEGELRDASQICIVDADGVEVPAQIDVATRWRDGSVRWALAGINASPQGEYRVEFGEGVTRSAPENPLVVEEGAGGALTVDTGEAVYDSAADSLLPDSARMGETPILTGSGDGAYLVDNLGRLARVAGELAEVETELLKQGPVRTVLRREGWYVTEDGERVARAKAWFYLTAGSPYLRITHTLVFTEDTNDLWVRDYGLDFGLPQAPREVAFALGEDPPEEARMPVTGIRQLNRSQVGNLARLYSAPPLEERPVFRVEPGESEVYMLQDVYPHFLEREFRAVIGRAALGQDGGKAEGEGRGVGHFWVEPWLETMDVAGDWGDAAFEDYALTLVMPRLAERFPKEIAFSPGGARAAFWSGRSGRDLDFRAFTLVADYWQSWAEYNAPGPSRSPEAATELAETPSNAQGAARTHDLWLLPRAGGIGADAARRRAETASRPPLLQADPVWLCQSNAVGWAMHHFDEENFAEEEALIARAWEDLLADDHAQLRRTGFIEWGGNPTLPNYTRFWRISEAIDYGLRRHAWWLYARSGQRTYYDYGSRFNRFYGDWHLAHWTAGARHKGGIASGDTGKPFHWGIRSNHRIGGNTGHDIVNWILEYYLTGDEYALDLASMYREGLKKIWAQMPEGRIHHRYGELELRVLGDLYALEPDDEVRAIADEVFAYFSDLEKPLGIKDDLGYSALYKVDNKLFGFSSYYHGTGDESARQAILKALDHEYRFDRAAQRGPMAIFFADGYRWTGNEDFLRIANYFVERVRSGIGCPMRNLPVALGVIAEHDGSIDPWPVVTMFRQQDSSRLLLRKPEGAGALELRCHVRMEEEFAEPQARLETWLGGGPGAEIADLGLTAEMVFQPVSGHRADPHRWHVRLTVPAAAEPGIYQLDFPGAERVDVLNSDAAQTSAYAPEGFRTRGDGVADYLRVEGVEELKINLSGPMELRCPDGRVVLEADRGSVGEQTIPVEGREGAWSLFSTRSEVAVPMNVEPLFSRSPEWLVTGAGADPAPRFERPSEQTAFVPGKDWQALHLPRQEAMEFSRGGETEIGYEFFPGAEGTVEFWFRPNWSSAELPTARYTDYYFLRAGSHDLQYRRGFLRRTEFAQMNLWAHGTDSEAGFTGRFWFEAGEWYHVAAAWRTEDGEPGDEGHFAVYINGQPVESSDFSPGGTAYAWPGRVSGSEIFHRREADETIRVGPLDGTIAQLRVSGTIRYDSPFEPPETLPDPDADTLAQFRLDGDYAGETADGSEVEIER